MSTGAIIAIAVLALIVIVGLVLVLPRMGERTRERELRRRRQEVSAEHREQAEAREQRAEAAERQARIAAQEARRERAEAQLHEERAALHEQGLADDELVEGHEHERYPGTPAAIDRGVADPSPRGGPRENDDGRETDRRTSGTPRR